MAMESSPVEYQPCPLTFFDFCQLDHREHCPLYSALLDQPEKTLATEELEVLQSEFRALQANVQNRIQLLDSELTILNDWQVKRDYRMRKRKHSDTSEPVRSQGSFVSPDIQPAKKPRPEERRSKPTKSQPTPEVREERMPDKGSAVTKIKGDAPDRFWASVEPYCADITESDLTLLKEQPLSQDNEELLSVPPLGNHYCHRWAIEDLGEEWSESNRLTQMAEGKEGGVWTEETESLLKSAESSEKGELERFGPLTQRLIAAFLEENPSQPSPRPALHRLGPPSSLPHAETLERRIREELISLGLFEPPELKQEVEEDEIVTDLRTKQAELRTVCDYNQQQKQRLHSLAKMEIKRQEIKQQLIQVDSEVVDWLKRYTLYKQKKKTFSRKEKDSVWKALETRNELTQKLLSLSNH